MLTQVGISQNEFCRRVEYTKQQVINWKKTGQFPAWVWWALKGMEGK
ncbi:hypothetical protein N480_10640 [Pseudoalteromonas luteoviolacea S2607]|nr:hypothetical protein N480_10640 [Pseudoalteromonas luteoviolacea S2607]